MSENLLVLGGAAVALLIVCLIARESTEVRLARMRTELMSLRNQERGLENQIAEMETTKNQVREAMTRAEGRQTSVGHLLESINLNLNRLHEHLRGVDMPESPQAALAGAEAEEEGEEE